MFMDMKTKTILMLIILATITFSLAAQTVFEKTVKGTTYVVTQNKDNRKGIKNKNGLFDKYFNEKFCPVYVKACNTTSKELVGKIFSAERIKKLASTPDTNMPISLICSLSGDVVAVWFSSVNTDLITWDEVKSIEDAYLQLKFVFDTSKCTDAKYCLISYPIIFYRLL